MKYTIVALTLALTACSSYDQELQDHLEAENDFARHQYHVEQAILNNYDPIYVDECYYNDDELICMID